MKTEKQYTFRLERDENKPTYCQAIVGYEDTDSEYGEEIIEKGDYFACVRALIEDMEAALAWAKREDMIEIMADASM